MRAVCVSVVGVLIHPTPPHNPSFGSALGTFQVIQRGRASRSTSGSGFSGFGFSAASGFNHLLAGRAIASNHFLLS